MWNAALSYCSAFSRGGPEAARRWAYGVWHGLYPGAKLPNGIFEAPHDPASVKPDEWGLIDREVRRYRKGQKRAA
jgi:hypothetical protein